MSECNDIIEQIYQHPLLISIIKKIKPEDLQDDLHQEIAIQLLSMPCKDISQLFIENNLLSYSKRICWLMATSSTSSFYYKYKKKDFLKAIEYFKSNEDLPSIPLSYSETAINILNNKNKTLYDSHEARIFLKYSELGSSRKVAAYFNIPLNHVCIIVKKVKKELKWKLLS